MATGTQIRITGLRETVRSLERLGVEASDLKAAFNRIGNVVVAEARSIVPVRTGRLSRSIRASRTKNKAVVRAGGAGIPYAGVIHYDNYNNITANPFLTNALEQEQRNALGLLEKELDDLIRRLDLRH